MRQYISLETLKAADKDNDGKLTKVEFVEHFERDVIMVNPMTQSSEMPQSFGRCARDVPVRALLLPRCLGASVTRAFGCRRSTGTKDSLEGLQQVAANNKFERKKSRSKTTGAAGQKWPSVEPAEPEPELDLGKSEECDL